MSLFFVGLYRVLPLWPLDSDNFGFWQFITYWTMHKGLLHLLTNVVVILYFAKDLERRYGTRGIVGLFLSACVISGCLFGIWFDSILLGSSAGAVAITTVWMLTFPYKKIGRYNVGALFFPLIIVQCLICFIAPAQMVHLFGIGVGVVWMYRHGGKIRVPMW